jgi:hypothetical protein
MRYWSWQSYASGDELQNAKRTIYHLPFGSEIPTVHRLTPYT